MNLSVAERYTLLSLLPQEGTFTTLKVVRKLREALSFSEQEISDFKIKETQTPNGVVAQWDASAASAEISIGEVATDLIVNALKKLNESGKLTDREFSLYEKFVEK